MASYHKRQAFGFESVLLLLFGAFLFQDLLCQSSEDEFVTAKVDTFDSKVASFISHKTVLQFSRDRNGYNLSTPKTEKFSKDCENGCVRYGLSFMQGWRTTMEDAVNCLIHVIKAQVFYCWNGRG
ncbi:unnamed protein product [Malus baccata var. baccata]